MPKKKKKKNPICCRMHDIVQFLWLSHLSFCMLQIQINNCLFMTKLPCHHFFFLILKLPIFIAKCELNMKNAFKRVETNLPLVQLALKLPHGFWMSTFVKFWFLCTKTWCKKDMVNWWGHFSVHPEVPISDIFWHINIDFRKVNGAAQPCPSLTFFDIQI